jgi:hypothetical protein
VHELAAKATYAGDAQPYRVAEPETDDADDFDDVSLGDRR